MAEQLAELAVGVPRVHGDPVNVPVPLLVKATVPVGALWVPVAVSVTVAVQLVGALTGTELGEQLTLVEVDLVVTVSAKVPELAAWVASLL